MRRVTIAALRVAGWMLALALVAVVAVAAMRAAALDEADRAALALMDAAPPPLRGTNGFAALMLAGHDVPVGRRDAVLAADVAAFAAWEHAHGVDTGAWLSDRGDAAVAPFEPLAGIPVAGSDLPDDALCPLSGDGCLRRIAEDRAGARALVAGNAARIAAVEAALAADHIANPYGASLFAPTPDLENLRLPLAAAALDAVDGRVGDAYARTCRLLAAARRTDRQARSLIDKIVAQTLARGAATLLLDLRRAHPVAALPGECAAARVPVDAAEAGACDALRGEFHVQRAHGARMDAQLAGWRPDRVLTRALLVDETLHAAALARRLAPFCTDAARDRALAGLPPDDAAAARVTGLRCWAAYVSCVLSNIATPAFADVGDRALDHAAALRLLLAAQRVADGEATPARAAVEAGVAGYPVRYEAAGQRASITLRAPHHRDAATFTVEFGGLGDAPPRPATDAVARL